MGENGNEVKNTLSIRDNRTGKNYEVEILDGNVIQAMGLRQIKVNDTDFGMMAYDPAFTNTASTRSTVTYIDGGKGILRYRGYPIDQLAERSSHLEVSYLLLHGELPTQSQLDDFVQDVTLHTYVHENITELFEAFRYDAHAMGMVISGVSALSTFYPEAKDVDDPASRWQQIVRLVAKMPTLAAYAYRHHRGLPYVYPENELSYTANFLNMLFRIGARDYKPNPVLERALDVLFILHADHEQNCSTSSVRLVGSSMCNLFASVSAAIYALWGPLHGGANQAVIEMLQKIHSDGGDVKKYVEKAKDPEDPFRLMGFGHRVYKAYDPRATVIKDQAYRVFEETGKNPRLDVALELERIALEDEYFVSRRLYPNVDFYSGLIYEAMGFKPSMFPVLFAIGRTPGWVSQWLEMLGDKEQKIARPRQIYLGENERDYVSLDKR